MLACTHIHHTHHMPGITIHVGMSNTCALLCFRTWCIDGVKVVSARPSSLHPSPPSLLAMTKGYTHMSVEQISMAKRWRAEGVSFTEIGRRLHRPAGTVYRQVTKSNVKTKPEGDVD